MSTDPDALTQPCKLRSPFFCPEQRRYSSRSPARPLAPGEKRERKRPHSTVQPSRRVKEARAPTIRVARGGLSKGWKLLGSAISDVARRPGNLSPPICQPRSSIRFLSGLNPGNRGACRARGEAIPPRVCCGHSATREEKARGSRDFSRSLWILDLEIFLVERLAGVALLTLGPARRSPALASFPSALSAVKCDRRALPLAPRGIFNLEAETGLWDTKVSRVAVKSLVGSRKLGAAAPHRAPVVRGRVLLAFSPPSIAHSPNFRGRRVSTLRSLRSKYSLAAPLSTCLSL